MSTTDADKTDVVSHVPLAELGGPRDDNHNATPERKAASEGTLSVSPKTVSRLHHKPAFCGRTAFLMLTSSING